MIGDYHVTANWGFVHWHGPVGAASHAGPPAPPPAAPHQDLLDCGGDSTKARRPLPACPDCLTKAAHSKLHNAAGSPSSASPSGEGWQAPSSWQVVVRCQQACPDWRTWSRQTHDTRFWLRWVRKASMGKGGCWCCRLWLASQILSIPFSILPAFPLYFTENQKHALNRSMMQSNSPLFSSFAGFGVEVFVPSFFFLRHPLSSTVIDMRLTRSLKPLPLVCFSA